jgi:SAM-dependent methyltransferase
VRLELNVQSHDELRRVEKETIRDFVYANDRLLGGRVLDFGSGTSPYADIVETAGGVYIPFDRREFPATVLGYDVGPDEADWGDLDAILMTQVVQYLPDPADVLGGFCDVLRGGNPGALIISGPTHWPIVEREDLHRFTTNGIDRLLRDVGFRDVAAEDRWATRTGNLTHVVGWQCVAHA